MSEKRVFKAGPTGTSVESETVAEPREDLKSRTVDQMTFSTHVLSLNAMALMQMGVIESELPVDLEAAHHVIDTLTMLRGKTQGNLDTNEQHLLDTILYDLRIKYVSAR
jgi:hypothetical protein